jgi:predicted ABC-type ATPase
VPEPQAGQQLQAAAQRPPGLYVVAGPNGAGKSSVAGAAFRYAGADYFNPDEAARALRARNPALSVSQANSAAWHEGRRLLQQAIEQRLNFAFETTLGGDSMTGLIAQAARSGFEVRIWYAALASVELHLQRIRQRVTRGGHDIPESDVRRRYDASRMNLIRLLPDLTALRMFDNSAAADPAAGIAPQPLLVLHWQRGRIVAPADLGGTPGWAKPIVAAAIKLAQSGPGDPPLNLPASAGSPGPSSAS